MTPYVVAILLLITACGPLTPKVDVNANVTGAVDTSGAITVKVDPTALFSLFLTQCRTELGPTAPETQVTDCATNATNGFFTTFGGTHG